MSRQEVLSWVFRLMGVLLVLSACASEEPALAGASVSPVDPTTTDQSPGVADGSSNASAVVEQAQQQINEARQVTPTTWRGIHRNVADAVFSRSGSSVVSMFVDDVKVWDVDNYEGPVTIPLDLDDSRRAPVLFSDQLLIAVEGGIQGDQYSVFDLKADDVAASKVELPTRSGAWLRHVAGDYFLFRFLDSSPEWELWNANDLTGPVDSFDYEVTARVTFGLDDDGSVFFVRPDRRVLRWAPQEDLEPIGDVSGTQVGETNYGAGSLDTIDGDRLLLIDAAFSRGVEIWDRATGEGVQLDGFDLEGSGRDPELKTVAFLPDGRVVAGSPGTGSMVYWDLARPSEPTIVPFTEDRSLKDFAVLPDGRILLSFGMRPPGSFSCCFGSEFELVTPPPA